MIIHSHASTPFNCVARTLQLRGQQGSLFHLHKDTSTRMHTPTHPHADRHTHQFRNLSVSFSPSQMLSKGPRNMPRLEFAKISFLLSSTHCARSQSHCTYSSNISINTPLEAQHPTEPQRLTVVVDFSL